MSFNLSALWKSHPAGSGAKHHQPARTQESQPERTVGYRPSDMAFLDEEDIKRLSVIHHQAGTN